MSLETSVTDPAPATPPASDPAPAATADPAPSATPAQPAPSEPATQATTEPAADWFAEHVGDDEGLRKVASRYGDVRSVIQALGETKTALRDSGRIKLPGEGSSDEERAAFRQQMGIPDTADGYEITAKAPEGMEVGEADKAFIARTVAKLHERGDFLSTPDAANMVHEVAYDMIQERDAQLTAAAEWQKERGETELRKEWGDAYDINMKFAEAAVASHFGKDWAEVSTMQLADGSRLGDHPVFIRGLMNAGRATTEDMSFLRAVTGKSDMTASSIDDRISEIQALFRSGNPADMKKYQQAQPELQELMARRERLSGQAA